MFVGQIMIFCGQFAPAGWAICDGSLMSIGDNPALFGLLGTSFGGDGETTFALPDLRSRVPLGLGQGPGLSAYSLGQQIGSEQIELTIAHLPPHSHAVGAVNAPGNSHVPANNLVLAALDGQAALPPGGPPGGSRSVQAYGPPGKQTTLNAVTRSRSLLSASRPRVGRSARGRRCRSARTPRCSRFSA